MQIKNQFLFACVAVMIFSSTQAATDQDPIIVTATRTAQTMDETLASVTVITREDIERKQAQSLMAILSGVSGIQMTRNGGYGTTTSMFLRGSNSNHVLVLVDGVKVGSATSGDLPWQHLPPSQIERIEIVRGPRSSLYGSEAMGGVIHIFTRKPGKDVYSSTASAGVGTQGTREFSSGISGKHHIYSYGLNIDHFVTNGIDAQQPTTGFFGVDEPDKDGYNNTSFSGRLGIQIDDDTDIQFTALRVDGNTEFDSISENETDFTVETLGAAISLKPSKDWESTFVVGRSLDQTFNFRVGGADVSQFDTTRYSAAWQNDFYFDTEGVITLGVDYQKDNIDSTTPFQVTTRDNTGVFVQYQDQYSDYDFLMGLRGDDNQQFGKHATGNIALGHKFSKAMRWFVSYGTAFGAPTFNDLYWPDGLGNPNLLPEESQTAEIALQGKLNNGRWRIAAYRTEVDSLIVFKAIPENIDKAVINGMEALLSTTVAKWILNLDLTLLDAKDVDTGNQLPRRPKTSFKFGLSREYSKGEIGLSVLAEGGRYDDAANTTKVNSYGIVNIYGAYGLNKHWILKGKIDNLFDKNYETIDTYNTLGRTIFVSLSYQYH